MHNESSQHNVLVVEAAKELLKDKDMCKTTLYIIIENSCFQSRKDLLNLLIYLTSKIDETASEMKKLVDLLDSDMGNDEDLLSYMAHAKWLANYKKATVTIGEVIQKAYYLERQGGVNA